ncbi:hypothetical protein EV421DRAFT_1892517 [Armillaria borealis]|uniref:CxC2-like cysteine cluster KDZ transposase-associated domain-containing protein n=1 Tax=Armillaria borealis TaxID=47425 RepID=A0AA39J404_9AGAR|nr:hypothetical protein EV421DRAFT_1892517 [Armillaria borealis]
MWNYNPKKHGKSGPARDVIISDGTDNQPSAPATEHYQHTHFSMKTKAGPTGERVRPSIRHSTVTLAALESEHPAMENLYPSIAELSSGSFLDPDYIPSAKVLEEFLNEILKLNAFETDDNACKVCKVDLGLFRCLSCMDARCLCRICMVAAHEGLPLHRIEEWCSSFFRKTTLAQLGLNYELGHGYRTPCLFPAIVSDFVIIDTEGIHTLLSFMSKVSAYKFYHTLVRLTDNSGMHAPPDRYQAFLRVLREWRHIRGIQGTKQGELAFRCPACPQPSINLPPDWNQNLATRWLYRLNLGYAYFVDETAFRNHIDMFGKVIPEEEKSTCNNHDAVKLANSRGGQGAAATGVGAVVCGRHDMKRPLSVGDLQKGERYLNMDYFVLSTLTDDTPPDLVISYDIACQWHKNLFARISKYPESLQPKQLERNILYLVPKFHLPAHILKCRDNFSFNFSAKVGRTDGEAPERGWAATNALAASTKEMGPGARRDTLDNHFGDYNWRKIITLAETLCSRLKEAVKARLEHVEEFIGYEDALQAEHSESVRHWRQIILLWESDRTQPNPFSPTLRSVTENAVRLELARQEKIASAVEIRHDVSPSELIAQGLQLEEAQVRLQCDINALGSHSTDLQRMKVQAQENRIQRKIEAWIEVQKVYMPRTTLLCTRDEDRRAVGTTVPPSKIPLYLPSTALRLNAIDMTTQNTVVDDEWRLRIAQANDTLAALPEHLLLKSYLTAWRQRFSFEWQGILRPLKNEDVRGLDQYNELMSEGHRNLVWIWKTNLQGRDKGLQEALRMEWCKSRARAQRWQEECDLLIEELHRVQVTFACYAEQWTKRAEFIRYNNARMAENVGDLLEFKGNNVL